jgi:cytochrome c1
MNLVRTLVAVFAIAVAGSAWAYQVTGPVLELTDTKIVVQKGKEKWELARTPDTKVKGDLKVGSQVTIEYSMTAKSVDVKPEKGKK